MNENNNIIDVNENDFNDLVIEASLNKLIVVDFWAPWCGPCKMIAPVLEEVGAEFAGNVKVCKINVDENTEIAGRFGVRGIPTLMLFDKGEVAGTKVGALSKSDLLAFISDNT